jgi:hydrogenase/urease accessory protein HupE
MSKLKQCVVAVGPALIPAAAHAHPGPHKGDLGWTLVHLFGHPDHLMAMAAIALSASILVSAAYWFIPWRSGPRSR